MFLIDLSYVKVFLVFSLKENDGFDVVKNVLGYIRKMFLKIFNWRKIFELYFYIDEVEKKVFEID